MGRERRDFDQHLEDDLKVLFDPYAAGTIPAWREPARARRFLPLAGGAGAAVGAKIVAGLAVVVLAAGATTEIVITHSANPADWARNVQQQVQGGQQRPAHSQPASQAHPSSTPVAGGSPSVPARVGQSPLPTLPVPTISPLPIPSPSVPKLP